MNQTLAFINQVQAYINGGNLAAAEGQPLLNAANSIVGTILRS